MAKVFRDASVLCPTENPAVSPHPPTAMHTWVPASKSGRTEDGDTKGAYQPGGSELKTVLGANARMTWVMPAVLALEGMAVCHWS